MGSDVWSVATATSALKEKAPGETDPPERGLGRLGSVRWLEETGWSWFPAPPHSNLITLSKRCNLSEPQFPHL